ncbi:MAG: 3-dehydroquinate synthase [Maricaulaceae bacterium]
MSKPSIRTERIALDDTRGGDRSYDVIIGPGVLADAGGYVGNAFPRGRAVVIADATAARLHGAALEAGLKSIDVKTDMIALEPGEARKSFADLEMLCEALLERRVERDEAIVAFGGGVIGDLAGFAAAIVNRGVAFIQVPTTLLAQVDSSVGGKTAINAKAGKNLIGAFHQPRLVLADVNTLTTLPERDLRSGFAEIAKAAIIDGEEFLSWLEANASAFFAGEDDVRAEAIARAVAFKARIVSADEREAGVRALLNLGHTFAHAFEAEAGYASGLRHGEAVAAGIVLAADYAAATGRAAPDFAARVRALIAAPDLPVTPHALEGAPFDPEALLSRMRSDKKNKAGTIRLVLPHGPGASELVEEREEDRLLAFLKEHAG